VLVAAAAVVIGAVLQLITIRSTRADNAKQTTLSRENSFEQSRTLRDSTFSQLRADVIEARIADLTNTLAEYMTLTYHMDVEQNTEKGQRRDWTAQYMQWADREDLLRSRILLLLDLSIPEHARLFDAVEYLSRERDKNVPWIKRRDKLLATAQEMFSAERRRPFAPRPRSFT
jgi:septal ring factor EnvC (AmiA/AmiB activator)